MSGRSQPSCCRIRRSPGFPRTGWDLRAVTSVRRQRLYICGVSNLLSCFCRENDHQHHQHHVLAARVWTSILVTSRGFGKFRGPNLIESLPVQPFAPFQRWLAACSGGADGRRAARLSWNEGGDPTGRSARVLRPSSD